MSTSNFLKASNEIQAAAERKSGTNFDGNRKKPSSNTFAIGIKADEILISEDRKEEVLSE